MQAGRELDALVTEKVMGLKVVYPYDGNRNHPWYETATTQSGLSIVPYYSKDISAAWQVMEKLIAMGFFEVQIRHWIEPFDVVMTRGWMCRIEGDDLAIAERSDTAPLAICLAALKAVNQEGIR